MSAMMQSAITSFYNSVVGQDTSGVVESQPTASAPQPSLSADSSQQHMRSKAKKRRSKQKSADSSDVPDSSDDDNSFYDLMNRALGTSTPAVSASNPSEVVSNLRATIKDLIKQKKSLESQVSVLNTELGEKQKLDKNRIQEIKRITKQNDNLLKRISQLEGMRKFTTDVQRNDPPSDGSRPAAPVTTQPSHIPVIETGRARFNEEVQYGAQTRPTNTPTPVQSQPRSIPVIQQGRARFDETAAYAYVVKQQRQTSRHPRQSAPVQTRPPAPPAARLRPEFDAVGTSIISGSGKNFNQQGAKATVYSMSGTKIRHIRSRIEGIIPKDRTSTRPVMTQCGGNDCCDLDEDVVIDEYEGLIKDIRRQRPRAPIVLSLLPLRKYNRLANRRIGAVNDYLIDRAQQRDNVHTIDVVPKSHSDHFTRKGIHFNKAGKELYARNVVRAMSPFMRMQTRPAV